MFKFVYIFPLVIIGAFLYAAEPNMVTGMASKGFFVALAIGFIVKRWGVSIYMRYQGKKARAHKGDCIGKMGIAIMGAGLAGNVSFAASMGFSWGIPLMLLATVTTVLYGASGFFGFLKPDPEL